LGLKNSQEIAEYLRNSDIYITASINDPCSNSLIEAISCGTPCLAYNSGGHTEIIEQTNSGLTFNDEKDFLEKLNYINDNYELVKNKINPFCMDHIVDQYINFIKSVV
jgi:glycosyltransferase involved in cell wall biosynthesis